MLQLHAHQRLSMADIVGHPWMQEPHANSAEVKQEFAIRHQRVQEHRQAEAEKNKQSKQTWAAQRGVCRGPARIGDKVYLDLATETETEETKDPSVQKIGLSACHYEPQPGKNTQFFSTYETTWVFEKLVEYLKDHQIKYNISDKYFKIEFESERMADKVDDEEEEKTSTEATPAIAEKCQGKIEIQKVNDAVLCVDFSRKAGSAWLFYEKFNFIQKDLAELNDVNIESTQ
jgi:hypothetical protein